MRRLIACLLLPCQLAACTSWKAQEPAPEQVLANQQPDKLRVTLTDGSRFVLDQPVVLNDTLSGISKGEPVRIPLADVSRLELRDSDTAKTIGGAVAALGLGILIAAAAASDSIYW